MLRRFILLFPPCPFRLFRPAAHAAGFNPAAPASTPAPAQPAPLADLVRAVDIPFESFSLANGLTTIVHTDRKAPDRRGDGLLPHRIEARTARARPALPTSMSTSFSPGRKTCHNSTGRSRPPGPPSNGSTFFDRTNYVVTVPKGALDLALFRKATAWGTCSAR